MNQNQYTIDNFKGYQFKIMQLPCNRLNIIYICQQPFCVLENIAITVGIVCIPLYCRYLHRKKFHQTENACVHIVRYGKKNHDHCQGYDLLVDCYHELLFLVQPILYITIPYKPAIYGTATFLIRISIIYLMK